MVFDYKPVHFGIRSGNKLVKKVHAIYFKDFNDISGEVKKRMTDLSVKNEAVGIRNVVENIQERGEALRVLQTYRDSLSEASKSWVESPSMTESEVTPEPEKNESKGTSKTKESDSKKRGLAAYDPETGKLYKYFDKLKDAKKLTPGEKLTIKALNTKEPVKFGGFLWLRVIGEPKDSITIS